MNRATGTVNLRLRFDSQEETRKAELCVSSLFSPEKCFTDIFRSFPNGVETRKERWYRLSDFFDEMKALPSVADCTVGIVFHVREDADPYWKDAILRFLNSVKKTVNVSVESITRTS